MSEFRVWDKENKKWLESYYNHNKFIPISDNNDILIEVEHDDTSEVGLVYKSWNKNQVDIFNYTRKKDINGKKIYANCSIVEFGYADLWSSFVGVFRFNTEKLRYEIEVISSFNRNGDFMEYKHDRMENFKIIDTIQENKLGLIQ